MQIKITLLKNVTLPHLFLEYFISASKLIDLCIIKTLTAVRLSRFFITEISNSPMLLDKQL